MSENTPEINNVESTIEDSRKNANFQRNRFGGRRSRFSNKPNNTSNTNHQQNQNAAGQSEDPNQNQMQEPKQEHSEEGKARDHRRPFRKPYIDWSEQAITEKSYNATLELPPYELTEKKFSGRNRIYISNISDEVTEEDVKNLFDPYGETTEIFLNKGKNFAFIRMDYNVNAVKARRELDGVTLKNKVLRMRISPSSAIVKLKNLAPSVTCELLFYAFSAFGEIENCSITVDERGKSIGEGFIDFARKHSALQAIQKCRDKCYFLCYSLKPVVAEPHELFDQSVGLLDKHFSQRNIDFIQERSVGPRLAEFGSFEHEYGTRWKTLHHLFKQKEEALRLEFRLEEEKLEAQMEYARFEQETNALREQLRIREMDKERQKREWEAKERHAEEEKSRAEAQIQYAQDEFKNRLVRQQDNPRRRQEEEEALLWQAQNLNSILDNQEQLDTDMPTSSTREMNNAVFDSYRKGSPSALMGSGPASENFESAWSRKSSKEGHWVREEGWDNKGFQAKNRRF